jgi:hypothetical protein
MRAGREGAEPTYVADLFLVPDYSLEPVEALPGWFLCLLQGPEPAFHTLAEAAINLPNWASYTEIQRYRREDQERRHMELELEELSTRLRATQERLDACRHRMEAANLHGQLCGLEGRAGLPRRPRRGVDPRPNHQTGRARVPSPGGPA